MRARSTHYWLNFGPNQCAQFESRDPELVMERFGALADQLRHVGSLCFSFDLQETLRDGQGKIPLALATRQFIFPQMVLPKEIPLSIPQTSYDESLPTQLLVAADTLTLQPGQFFGVLEYSSGAGFLGTEPENPAVYFATSPLKGENPEHKAAIGVAQMYLGDPPA